MKKLVNKRSCLFFIALILLVSFLTSYFMFDSHRASARNDKVTTAKERLQAKRNETLSADLSMNEQKDENEVVRAIVELKAKSVAETNNILKYSSKLKSKEKKVISNQKEIIRKTETLTGNKVVNQSGYLVNSFSIDATRKQMKKIAKLDGVEHVYEATMYKTAMSTAVREGNVKAQWESQEYGYTGEGVVVAVIDTGVNYRHQDMVLDKGVKNKYTKEQWQEKIKLLGYGNYFTEKVPFGYDYTNGRNECNSGNDKHGCHVSGIVAANGEVVGVAKNAQIIGLKVFGNKRRAATTDDIVKAIEDAAKLGADIINMSIVNSQGGIVSDENYMQAAVNAAAENGIISCISAGNAGTSSGYNDNSNLLNMKDTSTASSPAVAENSLSVASADNINYKSTNTTKVILDKKELSFTYMDLIGSGFTFENTKLVNAGVGINENGKLSVSKKKIKGNIVLLERGESTDKWSSINDKVYRLSKVGAKGIIIVDHSEVIDSSLDCYNWYGIPTIVVNSIEGKELLAGAKKSAKYTTVDTIEGKEVNSKIKMSVFSSWGPTNELGIKPEITAPGGNIKSTYGETDDYSVQSGTSMSSPFVAGSEAIMLNAIKARGIKLSGIELVNFMKNSLMNTAYVINDPKTGNPYSVRYQGAGMVDVMGAVDNNVLATYNGKAKVELGEMKGNQNIEITLTNYANTAAIYDIKNSQIYTDYTVNKKEYMYINSEYGIKSVEGAQITFNTKEVIVPANGSVKIKATVNLPSTFSKNQFVEAFIVFQGKGIQNIGMPVLGFYGNYDEESIIDKSVYDEGTSVLGKSLTSIESETSIMEFNPEEGPVGVLGKNLKKTQKIDNVDTDVTGTKEQGDNLSKTASINEVANNYFSDDEDVIKVNVGDIAELPIINMYDSVIYKLHANENTGCYINVDSTVMPCIYIMDENMNNICNNFSNIRNGLGYNFEFSMPKGDVYVEIESYLKGIGLFDIEFEKKEYNEEQDVIKLSKESDEENIKEHKLIENKFINIENTESGLVDAVFTPKKDGYYTFNIKSSSFISATLIEYIYNENGTVIDVKNLFDEYEYKKINKEVKLRKNTEYTLSLEGGEEKYIGKELATVNVTRTQGENVYALESYFDGNTNAFSPNNDNIRDYVAPVITQLRHAKEINVKVLDSNKKNIRTLASCMDSLRNPYIYLLNYSAQSLSNGIDWVYWDGTVYDKKTQKYVPAKDGQYYIQLESKITSNSSPQVITMPVKIDTVKPTLNKFEVTKENDDTIVTFNISDNQAMSPYFYVDIAQKVSEEEILTDTMTELFVETNVNDKGDYVLNLGNVDDAKINILFEDAAGNEIVKSCSAFAEKEEIKGDNIVSEDANKYLDDTDNAFIDKNEPSINIVKNKLMESLKKYPLQSKALILLKKSVQEKVSFQIKVEDSNLDEKSVKVYSQFSEQQDISWEYDGKGMYTISIALEERFDIIDFSISDLAGNSSCISIYVCRAEAKEDFNQTCKYYDSEIHTNLDENFIIEKEMLNKDGTFTIKGNIGSIPEELDINGTKVYVNPRTNEFEHKININKGITKLSIIITINGEKYSDYSDLYYDEMKIELSNLPKADKKGIIHVNKEVFNLAGTISSYTSVARIDVNGDNIYAASDARSSFNNTLLKRKFDYNVKLDKGLNTINITVYNGIYQELETKLKVYRD